MQKGRKLIVGLGNPGQRYELTRHNLGELALKAYANRYDMAFKAEKKISGDIAKGEIKGWQISLFIPSSYMNVSGEPINQCMHYYKFLPQELLIIVDDIDLNFGTLRLKPKGGAGGHKGLQSIAHSLGSDNFSRLRLGVGDRDKGNLQTYVLGRFTEEESNHLQTFIAKSLQTIDLLLDQGVKEAMNFANVRPKQKLNQNEEI